MLETTRRTYETGLLRWSMFRWSHPEQLPKVQLLRATTDDVEMSSPRGWTSVTGRPRHRVISPLSGRSTRRWSEPELSRPRLPTRCARSPIQGHAGAQQRRGDGGL